MSTFDSIYNYQNQFAKENPQLLTQFFGTTDVMPLWIADMDFKIAPAITEELQRLVTRGIYAYEFDSEKVFQVITDWYKSRHNLHLNPKSFLQVTGVLTGISVLIRELTQEGDGVLIQTPVYHQFAQIVNTSHRKLVENPLKIEDGTYRIDFSDLEHKLKTQNVKIIIFCNPHNPVGRVWNREEIQQLINLADAYNVTIISDEVHADIVFGQHTFNSIASFNQTNHIAVLGSPAKTFGMQSFANGYLYVPDNDMFTSLHAVIESMYLHHGSAFTTFATIAAYTKGGEWVNNLVTYLEDTLKWITEFMNTELPEVQWFQPEGTYQVWMDFSGLNLTKEELHTLVFTKAKLGLTPGDWFGKACPLFMRMNIASPQEKIKQAFKQLKQAIDEGL